MVNARIVKTINSAHTPSIYCKHMCIDRPIVKNKTKQSINNNHTGHVQIGIIQLLVQILTAFVPKLLAGALYREIKRKK